MFRLLIVLLVHVEYLHCKQKKERKDKEPTGTLNQQVHFISKKNKTHFLMEFLVLSNMTVVIFVETGKAGKENEENVFNEVSINLRNDGNRNEDDNSMSNEMIQVPMASTQTYSFSDIFISIRNIKALGIVPSYSRSEDDKLEINIEEPGDHKRDIVLKK